MSKRALIKKRYEPRAIVDRSVLFLILMHRLLQEDTVRLRRSYALSHDNIAGQNYFRYHKQSHLFSDNLERLNLKVAKLSTYDPPRARIAQMWGVIPNLQQ
jgi:hypothetical protein